MKRIKTINRVLSSLTLLSPLSGVGFNNQYQNNQTIITEDNNSLNKYFFNQTNEEQRKMGDITVTVEGTVITKYVSGTGKFIIDSDITEIGDEFIYDVHEDFFVDFSHATKLTTIGYDAFRSCKKMTFSPLPKSLTTLKHDAFNGVSSASIDLSQAINLTTIADDSLSFADQSHKQNVFTFPANVSEIKKSYFANENGTSIKPNIQDMFFLSPTLTFYDWKPYDDQVTYPFVTGTFYIYPGTKEKVTQDPGFQYDSSRVQEWSFNSSSSSINGSFDTINIKTTDVGNTESQYQVSGGLSVEGLANCFAYELVPTGSTQTIPDGLYFYDKKIYWDNVPEGQYEFKIKAHLDESNLILSDQTITINVIGDTPIPPEPTPEKSNIPLILGLLIGLGIPIILAIAFIIWYFTKKKKTTVKI